jgi:hypothetical protein
MQSFVDDLSTFGQVSPREAYALAVFCVAFAMQWATSNRLSSGASVAMFKAFYLSLYIAGTGVTELNQMGHERLVEWLQDRFKEYDPFAQEYFVHAIKQREFVFGDLIVKNLLRQSGNSYASLKAFDLAASCIVSHKERFSEGFKFVG